MPEQDGDRLEKLVKAVEGIETLELATASRLGQRIKEKLERGEMPTPQETHQLREIKQSLAETVSTMI